VSSIADWIAKGRPVQRTAAGVLAPVISAPANLVRTGPNGSDGERPTITRRTPEEPAKMKLLDVVNRALACCAGLPNRDVMAKSAKAYTRTFTRMRHEPVLDPLKDNIARSTFNHRRASLHFGSRRLLMYLTNRCVGAAEREDAPRLQRWARLLDRALNLIEPALALDPPLQPGASTWSLPPSRWSQIKAPRPRRGKHSKKHTLKHLPRNWMDVLWDGVPRDWAYRTQLAVHMTMPSRPEDLASGPRATGWSNGAQIRLRSPHLLEITLAPAKTHKGKYGLPSTTTQWDPALEGGAAAYLAELCTSAGGHIVVAVEKKDAMRKSLVRLGQRVFPDVKDGTITPYVIRTQVIADLKATVGAGGTVAAAAGQCTDRSQSWYGYAAHGRKRRGFIGVVCERAPRTGNVARVHALAASRKVAMRKSKNGGPKA